jgi:hypothetical protein
MPVVADPGMSFWAEIGVSKSKEAVIGDDEAVMTWRA